MVDDGILQKQNYSFRKVRHSNSICQKEEASMRSKKSQAVLARLKQITGTKSDASLSSALNISPQTLSSWKGRDSTPYSLCVEIAQSRGVSLDWLLLGEGPILRQETVHTTSENPDSSTRENTILALWRLLDEEGRCAIQNALEEKRRLRDLEIKLAEMASLVSTLKASK
jgi:hypothetical protein